MGGPLRVRIGLIRKAVPTSLTIIINMGVGSGGRPINEVMGRLWLPFLSDRLEIAQRISCDWEQSRRNNDESEDSVMKSPFSKS